MDPARLPLVASATPDRATDRPIDPGWVGSGVAFLFFGGRLFPSLVTVPGLGCWASGKQTRSLP